MKDLSKIHFRGKEPNEPVVMLLRRHKVALGKQVFGFLGGAVLIVVAYFLLRNYAEWFSDTTSIAYGAIVIVMSLVMLYLLLFMYHAWVDFYLDVWIVTNERIIATDQQGLFHRVTSELRLDRIQDVSSSTRGPFATLFKYGTVQIRTASEEDKFLFNEIAHPEIVARTILELHKKYIDKNQHMQVHGTHQESTIKHYETNESKTV